MKDFNSTFGPRSNLIFGESMKTGSSLLSGQTPTGQAAGYCRECGEHVGLITVAGAAETFRTDIQDICFLLNQGKIHPAHPDRLRAFICARSLTDRFEKRRTRLLDSFFGMEDARPMAADPSE